MPPDRRCVPEVRGWNQRVHAGELLTAPLKPHGAADGSRGPSWGPNSPSFDDMRWRTSAPNARTPSFQVLLALVAAAGVVADRDFVDPVSQPQNSSRDVRLDIEPPTP